MATSTSSENGVISNDHQINAAAAAAAAYHPHQFHN
jgi:hypothetical protein